MRRLRQGLYSSGERLGDVLRRTVRLQLRERLHRLRQRVRRFGFRSAPLRQLSEAMRLERSLLVRNLQGQLHRGSHAVQRIVRRSDEQSALLRKLHDRLFRSPRRRCRLFELDLHLHVHVAAREVRYRMCRHRFGPDELRWLQPAVPRSGERHGDLHRTDVRLYV